MPVPAQAARPQTSAAKPAPVMAAPEMPVLGRVADVVARNKDRYQLADFALVETVGMFIGSISGS